MDTTISQSIIKNYNDTFVKNHSTVQNARINKTMGVVVQQEEWYKQGGGLGRWP